MVYCPLVSLAQLSTGKFDIFWGGGVINYHLFMNWLVIHSINMFLVFALCLALLGVEDIAVRKIDMVAAFQFSGCRQLNKQ